MQHLSKIIPRSYNFYKIWLKRTLQHTNANLIQESKSAKTLNIFRARRPCNSINLLNPKPDWMVFTYKLIEKSYPQNQCNTYLKSSPYPTISINYNSTEHDIQIMQTSPQHWKQIIKYVNIVSKQPQQTYPNIAAATAPKHTNSCTKMVPTWCCWCLRFSSDHAVDGSFLLFFAPQDALTVLGLLILPKWSPQCVPNGPI
jgi:hypothetical protein